MVMAAFLSMKQGWISVTDFDRIKKLILSAGLTTEPPHLTKELFLDLMLNDKKNKDGHINLVLLKKIGHAFLTNQYSAKFLEETLDTRVF